MIQLYIVTKLVIDTAEIYDTNEAARLLGIGYATLYRWIKDGKLIPLRIGGRTFIPKSEIVRIKSQELGLGVAAAVAVGQPRKSGELGRASNPKKVERLKNEKAAEARADSTA